uniref:Uncharacterized protein n=1 Tax=Globisporangium ultimum (strain ATCC 200006 / CBS 805.95 / DAOM BR144) TaxID=431595 RepID=K3X2H9_GLOUD
MRIHDAHSKAGAPFIVLENASGTRKPQMAFNLMARDAVDFVVQKVNHNEFRAKLMVYSLSTGSVSELPLE